jgi:hypothetical protein
MKKWFRRFMMFQHLGAWRQATFERRLRELYKTIEAMPAVDIEVGDRRGRMLGADLVEFLSSDLLHVFVMDEMRNPWRAVSPVGTTVELGYVTRQQALDKFRRELPGAELLYVHEDYHYIFSRYEQRLN